VKTTLLSGRISSTHFGLID